MPGSEDQAFQALIQDLQSGALSYEEARRRYMELGDKIREQYETEMTALSVDVVDSHGLKQLGTPLENQATFDAYHRWVEEKLTQYGCRDATWAGDGLLALFDTPEQAVMVARTLLDGLPAFNSSANRVRGRALGAPSIQVRIGVHTGPVLTDPSVLGKQGGSVGRIASDTIDLAGHLQKSAAPNEISISPTTYGKLGEGAGQFVMVERDMPNPGTCFVYPPRSGPDGRVYTGAPSGAARRVASQGATAAVAPPPKGAGTLSWVAIGAAMLALGAVVGIGFMVTHLPQPDTGPAGQRPLVLQPRPGTPNGSAPSDAGAQTGAPPAQAASGVVPAQNGTTPGPAAPTVDAGPSPSRQTWTSPDANSGVPARVVQSPPEARWLLAIGAGGYRDHAFAADGAGADARAAAQILARAGGVPANHVQVLTDEQATLKGIRTAFLSLQSNVTSGKDTILVYLAGAGVGAPDRLDAPHRSGTSFALAPADATPQDLQNSTIYGADFAAWLGATRSQAVIVFVDASYGGSMDYPSHVDQGRQYAVISSVGPAQRTGQGRGPGGSPFVEALTQAFSSAADGNRDRQVSLDELQQYLRSEVPGRTGGAQNPEVHAGFGGFLPDFKFSTGG